jgi:hypothetical protein
VAALGIRLLGDFALAYDGDPIVAVASVRLQSVLAYPLRQGGAIFRGWALAKQGHLRQGIALTRQGIDGLRQRGHIAYQTYWLAKFREMLLWSKQLDEIEQVLQEVFDISEHYAQHVWDFVSVCICSTPHSIPGLSLGGVMQLLPSSHTVGSKLMRVYPLPGQAAGSSLASTNKRKPGKPGCTGRAARFTGLSFRLARWL